MIQEDISKMIYILQNVKFDDDGFAINLENRYSDGGSSWLDCSSPIWDFYAYEYRIKDNNQNNTDKYKNLDYWQKNAEEDYLKVPLSVLKYISMLEKKLNIKSFLQNGNILDN